MAPLVLADASVFDKHLWLHSRKGMRCGTGMDAYRRILRVFYHPSARGYDILSNERAFFVDLRTCDCDLSVTLPCVGTFLADSVEIII